MGGRGSGVRKEREKGRGRARGGGCVLPFLSLSLALSLRTLPQRPCLSFRSSTQLSPHSPPFSAFSPSLSPPRAPRADTILTSLAELLRDEVHCFEFWGVFFLSREKTAKEQSMSERPRVLVLPFAARLFSLFSVSHIPPSTPTHLDCRQLGTVRWESERTGW